jgi:CRISPR-associated protein Cas6
MTPERSAAMLDVGFALDGGSLPRDHRAALADAVERALPWLVGLPGAGLHRLNFCPGDAADLLLSRRTRLRLRVPRERAADAAALAGRDLQAGAKRVRIGAARARELLPHTTLYAPMVVAARTDGSDDEADFLREMQLELAALEVVCRPICGRRQVVEGAAARGFSLMLDGLTVEHSLRVLETGLGAQRRLGCGLFNPHRSAAAVGASS